MKVLYFTADWCVPCNIYGPIVQEFSDFIPIERMNVDEAFIEATQHKVTSVPTLVLVNGDKEINRLVGVTSRATLAQWLSTNTNASRNFA